jgi:hypothetical protein
MSCARLPLYIMRARGVGGRDPSARVSATATRRIVYAVPYGVHGDSVGTPAPGVFQYTTSIGPHADATHTRHAPRARGTEALPHGPWHGPHPTGRAAAGARGGIPLRPVTAPIPGAHRPSPSARARVVVIREPGVYGAAEDRNDSPIAYRICGPLSPNRPPPRPPTA